MWTRRTSLKLRSVASRHSRSRRSEATCRTARALPPSPPPPPSRSTWRTSSSRHMRCTSAWASSETPSAARRSLRICPFATFTRDASCGTRRWPPPPLSGVCSIRRDSCLASLARTTSSLAVACPRAVHGSLEADSRRCAR